MGADRPRAVVVSMLFVACMLLVGAAAGCSGGDPDSVGTPGSSPPGTASGESSGVVPGPAPGTSTGSSAISWLDIELTDVGTGEVFRIADFKGRPVLVKSFAVW